MDNKINLMEHLHLTYIDEEYERPLFSGCLVTEELLNYLHRVSTKRLELSDKQLKDLLDDVATVKALGLWDYDRENGIIKHLNDRYMFYQELSKLPEAEQQKYYRNILKDKEYFKL